MEHPETFIRRVVEYQRERGWSEATLGNRVANSATWLQRLRNRLTSFETDMRRFDALAAESPAKDREPAE